MGLGIDGSVIGNLVNLLTLPADLGHSVRFRLLQLLDYAVHNIYEDNLHPRSASFKRLFWRTWHLIASYMQLLANKSTSNVSTTEMDGGFTHVGGEGCGGEVRWDECN